ncbi:MAG TPA: type II secretion system protein [Candidatus Woesebacteria bacterium]|nr:type II secretion system protein [Candidatus Woesebacteria bacterium]
MKNKIKEMKGFTLVELLIVIALIAILSVAVLATINPIEQANKAKDSTTQNDAAEMMNAYERYYANAQRYPWMEYTDGSSITVDSAVNYSSKQVGFGICYGNKGTVDSDEVGSCNTTGTEMGLLVETDELKSSFANKTEFQSANDEDQLWAIKLAGSGGGIYVCYIPKAKANRQLTDKLYCIDSTNSTLIKVSASATDSCVALPTTDAGWSTPTLTGEVGMFRCVPE